MKKTFLTLVVFWLVSFIGMNASTGESYTIVIPLQQQNTNPAEVKEPKPRTLPYTLQNVELQGTSLSLVPLGGACTLDIYNADNDALVCSYVIPAYTSECTIPVLHPGNYLISIIYENIIYWGTFEL